MLTPAQLLTLKTDIEADPAFASIPHTSDGAYDIAQAYALTASPDFTVWRTTVTKEEIYANGFSWVQVDNVTDAKWRVWQELFSSGSMNPSKANVRAGVAEVWQGTAAKTAVRDYVFSKCKRLALRGEAILATGAGTDADPAVMTFQGWLSPQDVADAMQEG